MTTDTTATAAASTAVTESIRALAVDDVVTVRFHERGRVDARTVRVICVEVIKGGLYVTTTSGRSNVRNGGMLCVQTNGNTYYSPTLRQGYKPIAEIERLGVAN